MIRENIKKIMSVLVLVPAVMIFAGETGVEYFGLQMLAGAAIVAVLAWNGAIRRSYGRV